MEQQYQQQPAYPQQAPQPVAGVQPTHAPAPSAGVPNVVIASPTWIIALRGVQIVTSVIVLGLCGYLIHGAYADPQGFAIACVSPPAPVQTSCSQVIEYKGEGRKLTFPSPSSHGWP